MPPKKIPNCPCCACLPDRIVAEFFKMRPDPIFFVAFNGCEGSSVTGTFKLSIAGDVTSEITIPFTSADIEDALETILDPADFQVESFTTPSTSFQFELFGDFKSLPPPTVEVVDDDLGCEGGGGAPSEPLIQVLDDSDFGRCSNAQKAAQDVPWELQRVAIDPDDPFIQAQWRFGNDSPTCGMPDVIATLDWSCNLSVNMNGASLPDQQLFNGATHISGTPCCIPGASNPLTINNTVNLTRYGASSYGTEDSYCRVRAA